LQPDKVISNLTVFSSFSRQTHGHYFLSVFCR